MTQIGVVPKINNICLVVQPIYSASTHLHMYKHLSTSQLHRHKIGCESKYKTQLSNCTSSEIRKNYTIGFHRWLISINKITFYMIVKWFYCLTRFGQNRQFGPGYRCLVQYIHFFLATKCGSWAYMILYDTLVVDSTYGSPGPPPPPQILNTN